MIYTQLHAPLLEKPERAANSTIRVSAATLYIRVTAYMLSQYKKENWYTSSVLTTTVHVQNPLYTHDKTHETYTHTHTHTHTHNVLYLVTTVLVSLVQTLIAIEQMTTVGDH